MAISTRSSFLFPAALLLAWFFDFLFWKKPWGISVPVFTVLVLGLGFWTAYHRGLKPARDSYWLVAPIVFFSWVSVFRQEPFTLLISRALVVILSAILALTLLGGRWREYGFADHVVGLLTLLPRGLALFVQSAPKKKGNKRSSFRRVVFPILRGLLIGLPVLWFLAALLGSSDPFFAAWLDELFSFFNIEDLSEYLLRGFYIVILAYVLVAAYSYALMGSKREELRSIRKALLAPFLGFGEGLTILVAVNILFAAFVAIQFRYFFGGLAQVVDNPAGYTFAEYARRGFGELVVVSLTSLLLYIGLSSITRREAPGTRTWFSALGIALFALVSAILVSAYQRLLLYESAYGFTRMRVYPHVFMIWLGLLLLAVVLLELRNQQRAFALAVLLAVIAFAGTLAFINVDGFIAWANIVRAELGYDLDHSYLSTLSDDALPTLAKEYTQLLQEGNRQLANEVAVTLACHYADKEGYTGQMPWPGWNLSRYRAADITAQFTSDQGFPVAQKLKDGWDGWSVDSGGKTYQCQADQLIRG